MMPFDLGIYVAVVYLAFGLVFLSLSVLLKGWLLAVNGLVLGLLALYLLLGGRMAPPA